MGFCFLFDVGCGAGGRIGANAGAAPVFDEVGFVARDLPHD